MAEVTTKSSVLKILQTSYDIIPESITQLCSYFNVNYLISVQGQIDSDGKHHKTKYVVKIFNTANPSYFDNIRLQHSAMVHVGEAGLGASKPLQTNNGRTFVECEHEGNLYLLQVLTFLEGMSVNNAEMNAEEMADVSFQVGKFLSKFHESLESFANDFRPTIPFPFFSENALQFMDKLSYVEDTRMRFLIDKYMKSYRERFLPRLGDLRQCFIHGDFSDTNVIIRENENLMLQEGSKWSVSGIVDFEHCSFGYLIGELAVSIAYFMMKSVSIPSSNPIHVAKAIISGFQTGWKLTDAEKEVLLDVIAGRLCVSYISAMYESFYRPENKEYICIQSDKIPTVFEVLESMSREDVERKIFDE